MEKKKNSFLSKLENKFSVVSGIKEKFKEILLIVALNCAYMKKEYTKIPILTAIYFHLVKH